MSATDKLRLASNGTQAVPTSLASPMASGATTATLNVATGWPTATGVDVVMYLVDTSGNKVAGSQTSWVFQLTGTTLSGGVLKSGTMPTTGYPATAATVVTVRPTASWANDLINTLLGFINQDGTHKSTAYEVYNPTGVISPFAGSVSPGGWLLCDGSALSRTTYASLFTVIGTAYGVGDGSTTFNVPDLRGRTPVGTGTGTYVETINAATNVNAATDQITVSAAGGKQLINGTPVVASTTGTIPTGLVAATTYYVVAVDATHIKLATTLANALAGTPVVDITAAGTGNLKLTMTLTARALADIGGEEAHGLTVSEIPSHLHASGLSNGTSGSFGLLSSGTATSNGTWNTASTGGSGAHNVMQPFLALNYIIKT